VDIGIVAAQVLNRTHPKEFQIDKMAKLLGHDETLIAIKSGEKLKEIKARWATDFKKFTEQRKKFLIYE
jgi:uncharacterized protein YbbC (DUF1343 family)